MEVDLSLLKKMSAEYAEAKNVAIKGIYSFCILYISQALEKGTFSISWKCFLFVKPSLCFPCHSLQMSVFLNLFKSKTNVDFSDLLN